MRINKYLALATGHSRRLIDELIQKGLVKVNGCTATIGQAVNDQDMITLSGKSIRITQTQTIMLNKPVGYVCSRKGQGNKTIYSLLPKQLHNLKPVGRLDKNSSGLLLLTNNGNFAHQLTHPKFVKEKVYIVSVSPSLTNEHKRTIEKGIFLTDGISKLKLRKIDDNWQITMHEGKNRQIRRTFSAIGYKVQKLHRIRLGDYQLKNLPIGKFQYL